MKKCAHFLAATALLMVSASAFAQAADQQQIDLGRYIATMGDCMACHTVPKSAGKDFAGGYGIESPLGTIWSTNITPSKEHGIGNYSYEDFSRAVRQGVAKDGHQLYPAMPYDAYSGITDEDMKALYAYFMHGVKPVDAPPEHATDLPFPFSLRFSMKAWNLIYADGKPYTNDPSLSDQLNRGKYLTDTLGHCASCHTPRGTLMGPVAGQYLKGGDVGAWHAPDITGNAATGIGGWSTDQIVAYLKTGRAEGKGQAGGPMAEAVENSFQHMQDSDLQAIAAYLKTVDANAPAAARASPGAMQKTSPNDEAAIRGVFPQDAHDSLKTGAQLYSGYCASCHQPGGAGGGNQQYPSLFDNSATGAGNATNLIAAVLYGIDRDAGGYHALMPHFNTGSYVDVLSDQEVADIANYVLATWGNPAAAHVTPADVATSRAGGPTPLLAKMQPYMFALMSAGAVIALIIIAAIVALLRRRRRA